VLAMGGVFNLLGLIIAAPVLLRAYRRVRVTAAESVAGDGAVLTPEGSPLLRPDVPEA
jgi:hypothetical protein